MLCLGGSLLFAVVTVIQEIIIKKQSCTEYLSMIGFFGSIAAGFQMFMIESDDIYKFHWFNIEMLVQFGSFTLIQLLFYMFMALMLRDAGAVALHLSFISADYYTLIAGIILFQFKVLIMPERYVFCNFLFRHGEFYSSTDCISCRTFWRWSASFCSAPKNGIRRQTKNVSPTNRW